MIRSSSCRYSQIVSLMTWAMGMIYVDILHERLMTLAMIYEKRPISTCYSSISGTHPNVIS